MTSDLKVGSRLEPHPMNKIHGGPFQRELSTLIAKHGLDTLIGVPSFVVSAYLVQAFGALFNVKDYQQFMRDEEKA